MAKTNDEILDEYQSRLYQELGTHLTALVSKTPMPEMTNRQTMFAVEMMRVYQVHRDDPTANLLLWKLGWDRDDEKETYSWEEAVDVFVEALRFFTQRGRDAKAA